MTDDASPADVTAESTADEAVDEASSAAVAGAPTIATPPPMPPTIGSSGGGPGGPGGRASTGSPSMFGSTHNPGGQRAAVAAPTGPTAATMPAPEVADDSEELVMSEAVQRLQQDNFRLSESLDRAIEMVRAIDEPPMPPIVGDGFVIDSGQMVDFVRIGRLMQADGLIRSSHGSLAALSPTTPGLMHGTRDGALLPRLSDNDLLSGRLGEAPPPGVSTDWRLHCVMLAHGALEYDSVCATIAAHGPWTLAASLDPDAFVLDPLEALDPGLAKVMIIEESSDDADQVLRELKEALDDGSEAAVVVRGRVVLALGRTFDEAARRLATLEQAMQVTIIARMAGYDA